MLELIMYNLIDSTNWAFIHTLDVNTACEQFTNNLLDMMIQCIQSKSITDGLILKLRDIQDYVIDKSQLQQ